ETVLKREKKVPHVRDRQGIIVPRTLAIAEEFLKVVSYDFNEQEFALFLEVFQKSTVLDLKELWVVVSAMKLILLEQIASRGVRVVDAPSDNSQEVAVCVRSLREIGQLSWKDILDPLIVFDQVLRQDPAGAYAKMDFESRDFYRKKISKIA